MDCTAVDGLAVHEIVARGHSHRVWIVRIDEIKVVEFVELTKIDVFDRGVPNVDVIDESPAATEAGKEGFPKSQREPTDSAPKTESEPKVPAAKETNERRP